MALDQSPAPFSSLPPEIRNRIYRYLIPSDQIVTPTLKVTRRQKGDFPGEFLSTSKVFNTEAAPVLYSSNHFSFKTVFDGVLFLKRIGRVNRMHVEEMSFGTFWLTKDQTQELGIGYEGAQEMVMDWIATNFPSLTSMSFGGLPSCGSKWQMNTLEKLKYLIVRMPDLDTAVYSKRVKSLVLSNAPIDETLKVSLSGHCDLMKNTDSELETQDSYAVFNIDDMIEKNKVRPKALIRPMARTAATATERNPVMKLVRTRKTAVVQETSRSKATADAEEACIAKMAASVEAKMSARLDEIAAIEAKTLARVEEKMAARVGEMTAMEAKMAARVEEIPAMEAKMAAGVVEAAAKEAEMAARAEEAAAKEAWVAARMKRIATMEAEKSASAEKARVANKMAMVNEIAAKEAKTATKKKSELIAEDVRKRLAAAFLRK